MEIMNAQEVTAQDVASKTFNSDLSELLELQLAMVGGGMGDTQL